VAKYDNEELWNCDEEKPQAETIRASFNRLGNHGGNVEKSYQRREPKKMAQRPQRTRSRGERLGSRFRERVTRNTCCFKQPILGNQGLYAARLRNVCGDTRKMNTMNIFFMIGEHKHS